MESELECGDRMGELRGSRLLQNREDQFQDGGDYLFRRWVAGGKEPLLGGAVDGPAGGGGDHACRWE